MGFAASGSRVQYYYAVEDSDGNISASAPEFFPIRFNSSDLSRDTAQIESNEIDPARQRVLARQGTYSIQGSLTSEFTEGTLDALIAALLQSTWQSQATITATTISAAAADNSYNDSGNGFVSAGFVVGNRVTVTGFTGDTANNITDGIVTSVAAGKLIIGGTDGDVIVDDAAGESVTIQTVGDWLYVGSTVPTIAILKRHNDIRERATITGTTISAAASDNSLNDSGNGFVTAGFEVGQRITVRGFTGDTSNNVAGAVIESVAAGKIIVSGVTLVDDAAGESVTVELTGDYIYRGCRASDATIAAALNSAATLQCSVVGLSMEEYSVPTGATLNAANSNGMMVTTSGYLREDGTTITYCSDYNFTLSNNMNPLFSLFQRPAYAVENGRFTANGTMTCYLPDGSLMGKFIDETETNHMIRLQDQAGTGFYRIILPSVNYTQVADPVPGQNALTPQYTLAAGNDGVSTVIFERNT